MSKAQEVLSKLHEAGSDISSSVNNIIKNLDESPQFVMFNYDGLSWRVGVFHNKADATTAMNEIKRLLPEATMLTTTVSMSKNAMSVLGKEFVTKFFDNISKGIYPDKDLY